MGAHSRAKCSPPRCCLRPHRLQQLRATWQHLEKLRKDQGGRFTQAASLGALSGHQLVPPPQLERVLRQVRLKLAQAVKLSGVADGRIPLYGDMRFHRPAPGVGLAQQVQAHHVPGDPTKPLSVGNYQRRVFYYFSIINKSSWLPFAICHVAAHAAAAFRCCCGVCLRDDELAIGRT